MPIIRASYDFRNRVVLQRFSNRIFLAGTRHVVILYSITCVGALLTLDAFFAVRVGSPIPS